MADLDIVASDAPAVEAPAAPVAPAPAAPEPSRRETIEAAVAGQREKAAPATDAPKAGQPRAPDGKWAPIADGPGIDRPAPDKVAAPSAIAPAVAPVDPAAPVVAPAADDPAALAVRPPPGWSPASKVAFDALPDHVKADIAKRESEVNKGFEKLAQYKPVDKYIEMAQAGGTTLDKALEQYVGIENELRRDVFSGVERVLKNVGVNPVAFAQAYLNRHAGGNQNAPQAEPQARQQAAIDPQAIVQQVREQVRAEQEAQRVQDEIQKFAADPKNRFYENVKPAMAKLIQSGFAETLDDAYQKACNLDPTIAALLNQPAPVDQNAARAVQAANQARSAAKATLGAPGAGMTPGTKALDPNLSRRDTIVAAVNAQRARA